MHLHRMAEELVNIDQLGILCRIYYNTGVFEKILNREGHNTIWGSGIDFLMIRSL